MYSVRNPDLWAKVRARCKADQERLPDVLTRLLELYAAVGLKKLEEAEK